jgi:hypothetical protein
MVQITATNQELVELLKALQNVTDIKSTRFAFLVSKNLKELERHLRPLEDKAKPSVEFQRVAAQAHKLAEAEDKEGIEALEAKHENLIEERKQQIAELEKLMEQEVEIYVNKIKKSALPEDLTTEQLMPLLAIIEE